MAKIKLAAEIGLALLFAILPVEFALAQAPSATFDSRTIESATTISDGVCSNPAVGISYRLPEGMKPEDAEAMRDLARAGSDVGPEARYFLYGYNEAKTMVMLCGAASESGQVQVFATPLSNLQSEGPNALEKMVAGMGQQFGAQDSPARQETINGHSFERADVDAEVTSSTREKIQIRASSYASQVNSYVVMWTLIGYSEAERKRLAAGMSTVNIFTPQPVASYTPPAAAAPSTPREPVAPEFQARLAEFLAAWLAARDQTKTLAFLDPAAFAAPPQIGTYCDGWYRKGGSPQRAAQIVAQNLMGVPADFPKNSSPAVIFKAWDHFPPQWLNAAANNVTADHFLVAKLDPDNLARIFSGTFAHSDYQVFLQSKIQKSGSAYWAVFPELQSDGDLFVIFTLWQKSRGIWTITHIDTICQ